MADPAGRRRLSPNLLALLVLIGLGAALLAWQRPWSGETETAEFPSDPVAALREQLDHMSTATDKAAFVKAAGTRTWADQAWDARQVIGVSDASWEYVRGGTAPDKADGSALVIVRVEWERDAGSVLGAGQGSDDFALRVRPSGDGFAVVDAEAAGRPLPLWLVGELDVTKTADVTLVRVDGGGAALLPDQLDKARDAVAEVVRTPGQKLVVIASKSADQAASLLGRTAADISQIAAVTARVGGGDDPVTAIVMNPAQFATMDDHAQQVVLNHEATHMLTGAVASPAAAWVLEGFADFVAFHGDKQPVSVNARAGLAAVRESGPPKQLPVASDFSNDTHGLGALYEQTWLLFRMLGEKYGDAAVVDFYVDVLQNNIAPDKAVPKHFGVSTAQLVQLWGAYLEDLAQP